MSDRTLTEDEFDARWTHVPAEDGSVVMEWEQAKVYPEDQVWTWLDGDHGETLLVAGIYFIDAFGYAVTTQPWDSQDRSSSWTPDRVGGAVIIWRPGVGLPEQPDDFFAEIAAWWRSLPPGLHTGLRFARDLLAFFAFAAVLGLANWIAS